MYERLFIINDMKYDNTEKISIEENTGITINDVMFQENVVSRIEIEKSKMKYDGFDHLIIGIYMGNLLVGTIISNKELCFM